MSKVRDERLLADLRVWRLESDPEPFKLALLATAEARFGARWWMNGLDRRWWRRLDGLIEWCEAHPHRWPSKCSPDIDERALGAWLDAHKIAVRGGRASRQFDAARRQALYESLPGWDASRGDHWNAKLEKIVAWCGAHPGEWPSRGTQDPAEVILNSWLLVQRAASAGGEAAQTFVAMGRQQILDDRLPGWDVSYADRWDATLERVRAWREARSGAWPNSHSQNLDERVLGSWVDRQRRAARYRHPSSVFNATGRKQVLDDRLPGWNEPFDSRWAAKLELAKIWRAENDDRWPGYVSDDAAENRLGQWISVQRTAARGGHGSTFFAATGRRQILDAALPGWLK